MAKTVFQKNQKVWVESVGCWATVDKIVPIWAKGFDEPVRVTYDVGLGREFQAHELKAEDKVDPQEGGLVSSWRVLRARNKWQQEGDCAHHPYPGTYPVVVTDPNDWGGWRTPGAEYDRDPHRSLVDIGRAEQVLGWKPRHTWPARNTGAAGAPSHA